MNVYDTDTHCSVSLTPFTFFQTPAYVFNPVTDIPNNRVTLHPLSREMNIP